MSIPDTAVTFLVENIAQILKYNYNLVAGVKDNIIELQTELNHLGALMQDFVESNSGSHYLKSLVKEIKLIIDEAEDAVDSYLVQATVQKSKNWVSKAFHILDYPKKLREIGKKIQQIRDKVKKILAERATAFQTLQLQATTRLGQPSRSKEDPKVEEEHVVGFDGAIKEVSQLLTGGSEKLEVISIVGMLGLGKTTLAKKVFNQRDVDFQYMIRVFVYVSAEYERREVFLKILNSFTKVDEKKLNQMSEDDLETHLREELKGKEYLIVLDDVWEKKDWDRLKDAFPVNNKRCRVLITTRYQVVAEHARNSGTPFYKLDFLPLEKTQELLRWKVFRSNETYPKLVPFEEQIALKCDGLPLAIVVIAGIIFNHRENADWWKHIAESVEDYIARKQEETTKVIELMYKHLPNHLKLCFMYMGLFPEDYEIPVWKLIRLWLAEGLVKKEGNLHLEDIAEGYLDELVYRNVVIVANRRSNDKIKTCILHDTLREFCKNEAGEENFFKEIKKESPLHEGTVLDQHRRLCINSANVADFIASPPSGKCVRSLLAFTREETNVEPRNVSNIPKTFKLLRVLEIQSLKFQRFPIDLNHLILLKYIAISSKFPTLPKTMSALWSLQTLIVNTDHPALRIEADIWKLPQFRHLHTNSSTILPLLDTENPPKIGNVVIHQDIRTLSTIAPESCTKEILGRSKKLKKLGIRGNLTELFHGKTSLFSNLKDLESLENLRLANAEAASKLDSHSFDISTFPQQLTKLTLLGTRLGWPEMDKLGKLENLEILKVKDHAFEGKKWRSEPGGFLQLKHLHIGTTDLEEWEASALDFPSLKYLEVHYCYDLKGIPSDFAEIPTLQSVFLHCNNSAVALSASKLQKKRDEKKDKQFKVSVYPPDHLKDKQEA